MKKNIFIAFILCVFFGSCKSTSKNNHTDEKQRLEGEWTLNYINYPHEKLEELYTRGIPFISFDINQKIVSGNSGCNSFSGRLDVSGNTINFNGPMTMTKMYCEGQGEVVFMQNLNKTKAFSISKDGRTLQFTEKDTLLMRFIKK